MGGVGWGGFWAGRLLRCDIGQWRKCRIFSSSPLEQADVVGIIGVIGATSATGPLGVKASNGRSFWLAVVDTNRGRRGTLSS